MLSQILDAMCLEIEALFSDTGNTVLRDTQFKPNEMPLYTIPCIVLSLTDSPEIKQMIGGATKANFGWHIKAYFYDVNSDLSVDDPFSTEAYDIIHTIYKHFSVKDDSSEWLTPEFTKVCQDYGYKLTLNGMQKAETLKIESGVCPGFSIVYDSVGFDLGTSERTEEGPALEDVKQVPEDSFLTLFDTDITIEDVASFSLETNTFFIIEQNQGWLTISPAFGNESQTIELNAITNDTGKIRKAVLTIKAPASDLQDQIINVTQL